MFLQNISVLEGVLLAQVMLWYMDLGQESFDC